MLACQGEFFLFHVEGRRLFYLVLPFLNVGYGTFLLEFREGQLDSLDVVFFQFLADNGIVVPIDKCIFGLLILYNAHLGVHIVLHAILVTVQMVWGDVHQDGHVGSEIIHVV